MNIIGYFNNYLNTTISSEKSQHRKLETRQDLTEILYKECREIDRIILNEFVKHSNVHESIYLSQIMLAEKLDYSREHINRRIKHLKNLGLLESEYRYKKTCIYKLNPIFFKSEIRNFFKNIIHALGFVPLVLGLITTSVNADPIIKITECLTTRKEYLNILTYLDYRERGAVSGQRCKKQKGEESKKSESRMKVENKEPDFVDSLSVQVFGGNPISKTVMDLDWFSTWGKIKASAFTDKAVMAAACQISRPDKLHHPFQFFCKIAREYSQKENLPINYHWVATLAMHYRMPVDAIMVNDAAIKAMADRDEERNEALKREYAPSSPSQYKSGSPVKEKSFANTQSVGPVKRLQPVAKFKPEDIPAVEIEKLKREVFNFTVMIDKAVNDEALHKNVYAGALVEAWKKWRTIAQERLKILEKKYPMKELYETTNSF